MAILIQPDGTSQELFPTDARVLTLEEMQRAVGGFIEAVSMSNGRILIVNENGKVDGLPRNEVATILVQDVLREDDYIVGPALVVTPTEMGD